jgi:hypothetical protein
MELSRYLAKCIGIYFLILATAMFINMPQFIQRIDNLLHESSVMYMTGFFTLILGIMMVVGHNIWEKHWRVIVTVIGWITLIKGILIIYSPYNMREFSMHILSNPTAAYAAAGIDFALGCVLLFCAIRR